MTTKANILIVIFILSIGITGYVSYRKGYADGTKTIAAEYGNDWNSDPSVKHSGSYSVGYSRGHGDGEAEANQKDFNKCSDELAQLAVEAGNAKVAGKWLAQGFFAPSQLEPAEARLKKR